MNYCTHHPKRVSLEGRKLCKACTESRNIANIERCKKAKETGCCPNHINRKVEVGRSICLECRTRMRLRDLLNSGLSEEEVRKAEQALENFDGFCQCCGSPRPRAINWRLDHDDKNKIFRGIICNGCNSAIGHAEDDPEKLELMAKYIRRSQ